MNILHSQTDPDLLTRLREMLDSSASADIAVGYFFMSGFEAVADSLSILRRVRILVGRTDRQTLEEVAIGLQQAPALQARIDSDNLIRRSDRDGLAQDAVGKIAEGVGMLPQNEGSEKSVKTLRDLIAAGFVEVRAYLKSPLHAKAYLCWYEGHAEPGAAIVGSSNMTLAGFSGNTELNVRVTGDAEMDALRDWFDNLWDDSEDIADALVTELDQSWPIAQTPPYLVYLKALYELYYSDLGPTQLPLPPRHADLANFQIDAVSRGLTMIEAHGGCYIGDVVGLGKTFVGAELLRQLRQSYPNDGQPLILCPAGLIPMWRRVNEQFGLGAEVVSHSMITSPPDPEFDEESGLYIETEPSAQGIVLRDKYQNRGPVLVDEAHNFRNINQRSRGLRDYLESGDHKVVLLSATPQNLGPMDIYRQLSLFLDDTNHGLNIEPLNLQDYFNNARRWQEYKVDFENYQAELAAWHSAGSGNAPPSEPTRPNVPKADIQEVLSPVFIRRRRRDISEVYGESAEINGEPVRFPEPVLDNVEYRLDKVYERAGSLDEIEELLRKHKAYRYRATEYIRPEARDKPKYRDLFRAQDRIVRLMAALVLKRLESSIEAFRSTLNSLIRSNRNFREALEAGFVPIGSTAARLLNGEAFEAEALLEMLEREQIARQEQGRKRPDLVHDVADFEIDRWLPNLDADYDVLQEIFDRVKDIEPKDDDKLRVLREYLERDEVMSGKLLVFSEAETTINYLYEQLNPDGADATIVRLTGSTGAETVNIVRRFSPGSNLAEKERMPGPEIRLLLATDVVSEGQNLQDCSRVLNYDLHWNPVKLIQRFGRVDRIGTKHAVIDLNNMWPDRDVDQGLDLTERLIRRAQSFHDLIGLDSKLLHESERLNENAMYRIYVDKQLPEIDDRLDEVATNQRAATILQRIQDDDPDLWRTISNLPDGIRSALEGKARPVRRQIPSDNYAQKPLSIQGAQMPMSASGATEVDATPFDDPRPGETIALFSSDDVRACYAIDDTLLPRSISPAQFIAAAECLPETPTQSLPAETNARVMAAFHTFRNDYSQRLGRARRPRHTVTRRYLTRQLAALANESPDNQEKLTQIAVLRSIFTASVPPQVESALSEIRMLSLKGDSLLTRLQALRERYRLNPPEDTDEGPPVETRIIRIVCSDGLI